MVALIIGSALRLINLGSVPQGFTWDEAALGYNAYSIIKTGRDEFGKFLPLIFKVLATTNPGFTFTLQFHYRCLWFKEFATRLPSALAGIMAI